MRMRVWLVFTTLVALATAAGISLEDLEFKAWKLKFDKIYKCVEEESQRKMIWLENRKMVLAHNMLADQGIRSYRLGMNYFADQDKQEYRESLFKDYQGSFNRTTGHSGATFLQKAGGAILPDSVDWREKGYVTEVKNSYSWAASATGSLEGQMFKKTGNLVSLSEQQLMDCMYPFWETGCWHNSVHYAFEYIINNNGIDTEKSYPYRGDCGDCRFNPDTVGATCTNYKWFDLNGNETALQEAVATIGPISAVIDATSIAFQLYQSGIYDDPDCSSTQVNLDVLVVGYGRENGQDYWLVKNSWSCFWGENGYIKMSRNKNNLCGIATLAIYPLV